MNVKENCDDAKPKKQLFGLKQMPEWLQPSPFIQESYRPAGLESYYFCFQSIFAIHNETINIWTHLLAFVWYAWMLGDFHYNSDYYLGGQDKLLITALYISWMSMWIFSSTYHCLRCHSEAVYHSCYKLDLCGIVVSMSTATIVFAYYAFYFDPNLKLTYISVMTCMGLLAVTWVAVNGIHRHDSCFLSLIILALMFNVAVTHFASYQEPNSSTGQIVESLWKMNMASGLGCVAFYGDLPERYLSGQQSLFSIIPQGHQIMHIATSIAGWYTIDIILITSKYSLQRSESVV